MKDFLPARHVDLYFLHSNNNYFQTALNATSWQSSMIGVSHWFPQVISECLKHTKYFARNHWHAQQSPGLWREARGSRVEYTYKFNNKRTTNEKKKPPSEVNSSLPRLNDVMVYFCVLWMFYEEHRTLLWTLVIDDFLIFHQGTSYKGRQKNGAKKPGKIILMPVCFYAPHSALLHNSLFYWFFIQLYTRDATQYGRIECVCIVYGVCVLVWEEVLLFSHHCRRLLAKLYISLLLYS